MTMVSWGKLLLAMVGELPQLGWRVLSGLLCLRVWGDGACQGQTEVIRECAPRARDFTQRRCRYKSEIVDEVAWAKNLTKSKVRAKVEHVFQVLKLRFGFVKVRYRGLKKNAHRLFVTSALVNLFVSRKKLLLARV